MRGKVKNRNNADADMHKNARQLSCSHGYILWNEMQALLGDKTILRIVLKAVTGVSCVCKLLKDDESNKGQQ